MIFSTVDNRILECILHDRIAETEFMEFADIENHDDFYSVDEGRVHVQDQRGYYIMYEKALQDLKYVSYLICRLYIFYSVSS